MQTDMNFVQPVQALPGSVGQYAGLGTVAQNIVTTVTNPPVVSEKTTRGTRGVEIAVSGLVRHMPSILQQS